MKYLIPFLLTVFMMFTACSEEEIPSYDLNIISPVFEQAYNHYSPDESETEKYVLSYASDYNQYMTEENLPYIETVTICDGSLTDEAAGEIISICKTENIPVFFLMSDVNPEILATYDKAFCISADYTYIGEIFAEKINSIWQNELIDKDGDKIFTFSVIKPETLTTIQQTFYDSMLKNIELLGIPLEQLEEIYLSKGDVLGYCTDNKKANEAFFILESNYLSVFPENYEPMGEGKEIIGIEFGTENIYKDYPYMLLCFIDYTEYFDARDAVMKNIENKVYPFKDLDYSIIDKNLYIQPVI